MNHDLCIICPPSTEQEELRALLAEAAALGHECVAVTRVLSEPLAERHR